MFILYSGVNQMTLPFMVDSKRRELTFSPGKNWVNPDDWKALVSERKQEFDSYYSTVLRVFQPRGSESDFDKSDEALPVEVGTEAVDFTSINVQQAIELIKNTTELEELREYLEMEKLQKRPRKAIIKALEDKIELIGQTGQGRQS